MQVFHLSHLLANKILPPTDAQAQCAVATKFMALAATSTFTFPPRHLWPIGFGFRPTEEELITHYLTNKILGRDVEYINDIDLYNYDPWELPEKSFFESDNYEWFFFRAHTPEAKRTTRAGCWKTTGDDRLIMARETNKVIATRKILVFYQGRGADAVKTNWVIHEYHLHPDANSNQPFVVCRLKKKAEERHVSICDQDEHNSTVASHLKKKGKRNRDGQASAQSVHRPLRNSRQPPALADFQPGHALNMQPSIQPGASENEDNLTEILKSILLPEECLDDATSKMCRSPWSSLPEPAFTDFQPSIGNDGEVNNQLFRTYLHEHFLKSLSDDENCGEVTSNNRIDSYNKEGLDSMVFELEHGGFRMVFELERGGFSSVTDTDTAFVLPNNHFSSSCFEEYGRSSAVQNMSTIKKSHRSPLAVKRFPYKEERDVLQGGYSDLFDEEGEAGAFGIFMDSANSNPGTRTFKDTFVVHQSSDAVSYESEPKRDRLKREIRSKLMSQYKAKEDEEHTDTIDSNNHFSSSCFEEYGRSSAVQNMSTIKKSHRSPLAVKRFPYKEERDVLQGGYSDLSDKEGEAGACGNFMDSANSNPGTRTFKYTYVTHQSSDTVSYESEPKRDRLKREIGSKAMSQYKAKEDEEHTEMIDSNNRFSYILTTKCIRHNSSLPLVYVAKAFLGILMFVMFAQELLLYGHRR